MKEAFIGGDYLDQFYPWSMAYSEAIKNFRFLFWTRYFHSGFPLIAEGQIGGFYPLNIIMFFLLPFKIAYNYSVILHFALGGVFTYFYSRRIGADQWGGSLSALLFCFGSAYAGLVMMRTLVWFPLVLLLIDNFFSKRNMRFIVLAALVAGIQFLAGFIQMAAYCFIFYILVFICGFIKYKINFCKILFVVLTFLGVSIIVSLPQLVLSFNLAQESSRAYASLGFALWGSIPPPVLLNIFFPKWLGLFGAELYIGIFSLLFLIYCVFACRTSHNIRLVVGIMLIALFASLGKYNPLYVGLIRITEFYGFRNPSKFLFFVLFAGSVLAGTGFSEFFNNPDSKRVKSAALILSAVLSIVLCVFFIAKLFFVFYRDRIILFLQNYTLNNVVGKPYHRYSHESYMQRIEGIYSAFIESTNLGNIYLWFSLALILSAILVCVYICKKPNFSKFFKVPIFCVICLDIFVYSFYGTGFRGNIKPFAYSDPSHIKILSILKSDEEYYRILPFGIRDNGMPLWVIPSANMLVKIDSVAGYTPLVKAEYRKGIESLEVVDNALGLLVPENNAIVENFQKIRMLNVKYIITVRDLKYSFLEKVMLDQGVYLYKVRDYMPRIFFSKQIDSNISPMKAGYLDIVNYRDGFAEVEVTAQEVGFLVLSENYDPGWRAYVNGQEADIIKVQNLIQAVKLEKGTHTVTFKYKPRFFNQ